MTTLSSALRNVLDLGDACEDLIFHGEVWRSRAWLTAVAEHLERILKQLGVDTGMPIGFAPLCRPEWAAALMGLVARNRPITMVYAYQSPAAIADKIAELKLSVLIADAAQWDDESLAAADREGCAAIRLGCESPFAQLLNRPTTLAPTSRVNELGVAFLTSGTTGPPRHFHIAYPEIYRQMVAGTAYGADPEKRPMLAFYPPSNISGIYTLLPPLAAGQRVVMLDKFGAEPWARFVETWRPTTSGLPVPALSMILEAEIAPRRLASLHYVSTGASSLPAQLRDAFETRYGIPVLEAYGATEFGGVVASMTLADRIAYGNAKAASAGRPLARFALRITDPDTGEIMPAGAEGRLEVLPRNESRGWVPTTDLAMLDDEGFLYCRGRLDGVISRGGFKIMPEQIAAVLLTHPDVSGAAVVGLPDARLGEIPAALVEPRPGTTLDEAALKTYLRGKLPAPAVPNRIGCIAVLPRTVSLKPDLGAARAWLLANTPL
jgi:acyl-coenzyme A synthetase/AMP-(fatty) acid ligase